MDTHGYPWESHGYPWTSMDIHSYPWTSMDIHDYLWRSMDIHGYPWTSMDIHGYPWNIHGYPRISMDFQGLGEPLGGHKGTARPGYIKAFLITESKNPFRQAWLWKYACCKKIQVKMQNAISIVLFMCFSFCGMCALNPGV